jgi:nitrite reductase/ring-hydroxylating ferredoxin subunit
MALQRVARISEIPAGRGLSVEVDGVDVGLFRVDGVVHAMENTCPHREFPLSEGELHGCVIVCKAHGWDFDVRTGFKPGDPDGFPIPCYVVEVQGDEVWVDVARPTNLGRPPR